MDSPKTLYSLSVGESGTVKNLLCTGSLRRRFMDIGLIAGTKVCCVGQSPHRNPKAYLIRGAVIALRTEDSQKVLLEDDYGT